MNTIHDVLRFILSSLRHVASDVELAQAQAIVDAHEKAYGTPPDAAPAPGPDPRDVALAEDAARIADLESQLAAARAAVPPAQGGF